MNINEKKSLDNAQKAAEQDKQYSPRSSDMLNYNPEDSTVVYETKHIKEVRRNDNTRAIGAKTLEGMLKVTYIYSLPKYATWIPSIAYDGLVYLLEEVR